MVLAAPRFDGVFLADDAGDNVRGSDLFQAVAPAFRRRAVRCAMTDVMIRAGNLFTSYENRWQRLTRAKNFAYQNCVYRLED